MKEVPSGGKGRGEKERERREWAGEKGEEKEVRKKAIMRKPKEKNRTAFL